MKRPIALNADVRIYELPGPDDAPLHAFCGACSQGIPIMTDKDAPWGPHGLIAPDHLERYQRSLTYRTARARFVQTYAPGLACHNRPRHDEACTDLVTHYYFSSGQTLPFCTRCVEEVDVMGDNGIPMSREYYVEVYELKSGS